MNTATIIFSGTLLFGLMIFGLFNGIQIIENKNNIETEAIKLEINFTETSIININDSIGIMYIWTYDEEYFIFENETLRPENYSTNTENTTIWYNKIKK
jgi:hypothetical protein